MYSNTFLSAVRRLCGECDINQVAVDRLCPEDPLDTGLGCRYQSTVFSYVLRDHRLCCTRIPDSTVLAEDRFVLPLGSVGGTDENRGYENGCKASGDIGERTLRPILGHL